MSDEGFTLLPGPADACPSCAVKHEPDQPHDAQSLFYQYRFYGNRGRWPTWKDAIDHCAPAVREAWERILREQGHWTEPDSEVPDVLPTPQRTGYVQLCERARTWEQEQEKEDNRNGDGDAN